MKQCYDPTPISVADDERADVARFQATQITGPFMLRVREGVSKQFLYRNSAFQPCTSQACLIFDKDDSIQVFFLCCCPFSRSSTPAAFMPGN